MLRAAPPPRIEYVTSHSAHERDLWKAWIEYAQAERVPIPVLVARRNLCLENVEIVRWTTRQVILRIGGRPWGFPRQAVAHENSKEGVATLLVPTDYAKRIVHYPSAPSEPAGLAASAASLASACAGDVKVAGAVDNDKKP
jgi:hypothetical protein